jgi:ATP-dependent helicase HrpA
VGRHLIKKSWSDPHWEKSNGGVVAFEKGTLYGLPVYGQRRVNYAPIDPKLSRELFIKEALVAGQMESNAPFWQHNSALIRQVEELEHKSRRPDVLISDDVLYDFYNKKLDDSVVSVAALDKWRRENEAANPKILYLSKEDLMRHDADGITIEYFPKTMEVGGVKLALTYHFEPGAPRDGVTLAVPVYLLNQIDEKKMEWLVPGMVKEKVAALLKTLPQKFRRHFVPLPEWGAKFAEKHEKPEGVLLDVIREEAAAEFRIDIKASDFKLEAVAPHLFLNYKVIDEHGRQLDMSRNLAQLRSEWGIKAREAFQEIASANVPTGDDAFERMEDWSCGELPDIMEIRRKGMSLIGHPAVVSHGDYCSVEVFDDPQEAERETRAGVRNLVKLILKEQVKYVRRILEDLQMAYVQASSIPPLTRAFKDYEELKEAVLDLALNQIMRERDLPNNKESFDALCQQAKNKLSLLAQEIARLINSVVAAAAQTHKKVKQAKVPDSVIADINGQVSRMFPANFLASVDYAYLKHYPRYLKAIEVRLEKYRSNPERDAANMAEIEKFTKLYIRAVADRKGVRDEQLDAFGNAIDELRVSLFAQELRTPFPVSVKRLQKMWQLMQR